MSPTASRPQADDLYRPSARLIVEPCPMAEPNIMLAHFETKNLGLA
jgi:hypothetical protein